MIQIPDCFYRVSVKALILDETRTKFLIAQEDNLKWELPGGGLDWGESPKVGLAREIKEEMGLDATMIMSQPSYLVTIPRLKDGLWTANVIFETKLQHLNFVPSSECIAIKFVTASEAQEMDTFPTLAEFAKQFNPDNHKII